MNVNYLAMILLLLLMLLFRFIEKLIIIMNDESTKKLHITICIISILIISCLILCIFYSIFKCMLNDFGISFNDFMMFCSETFKMAFLCALFLTLMKILVN